MHSVEELLAISPWTKELTPEQLARVENDLIERAYVGGSYICHKGQPADAWIGVLDGLVKLNVFSHTGKAVSFAGIPAGSWFGEGSVLKAECRKYDVIALRDSRIVFLPEKTFHWLLNNSIPFNRFLLMQLNERLGQFISMVEHDRLLDPDARVARALASLFNTFLYPGAETRIQISQEELGYIAGASRQRVNQALRLLEAEGLVQVDYGMITVLDIDGLRGFEGGKTE
ncbi:MAG: Crp/Fnr family transcriptional regulator [Gammaproteobacteria bacterium]